MNLRVRQFLKMGAQNIYLPLVYNLFRHQKVREREVLFADAHHAQRPENMQALYDVLRKDPSVQIREIYLDYQKASFGSVLRSMSAFMKAYAGAGCVVLCDNFLPAAGCRKRPQTRVVQLWHACGALKKFGYDAPEDIPASYHGNVYANTDLVTVSAPVCESYFAGAMHLPKDHVRAMGVCRTDQYFDAAWRERAEKHFREAYPDAAGKKVVVWAPTFRGNAGDPQLVNLDIPALQRQLGEGYLVLTKLHPHMEAHSRIKSCPVSTQELFIAADAFIADYSSLIFEYLLFGKPLILYVPDYKEYAGRRGFYMNYDEIPGKRVYQARDLAAAVRQSVEQPDEAFVKAARAFCGKYMSACDGHSAQRVADFIRDRQAGT